MAVIMYHSHFLYCNPGAVTTLPGKPYQSPSSNWKSSSTACPKVAAIFNANMVEGTNLPLSMAFIVCLLTPVASANCCCVMRTSARATRILFFIFCYYLLCSPYLIAENHHKDKQNRKHIIHHHMQEFQIIDKQRADNKRQIIDIQRCKQ